MQVPFTDNGEWIPPGGVFREVLQEEDNEEKERIQQERIEKARSENNYIDFLKSDYDKIKADADQDGKVSLDELKEYIIFKEEFSPPTLIEKHHYYHFDTAFYILFYVLIGSICLTTIISSWIKKR